MPPVKPKIKSIKLKNFKSFVGESTIGPLGDFTVFTGSHELGNSDLMDAIDFAFGVYNPLSATILDEFNGERCPANAERSVEIGIQRPATFQLPESIVTFKRHLMFNTEDNTRPEFEINGLVICSNVFCSCS